jgi:hypothetical protein
MKAASQVQPLMRRKEDAWPRKGRLQRVGHILREAPGLTPPSAHELRLIEAAAQIEAGQG